MILNRNHTINLSKMQDKYEEIFENANAVRAFEEFSQLIEMQQVYGGAMKEICTKLEILDEEFKVHYRHNPIHHIESRLKNPKSMLDKLVQRNLPASIAAAREHLTDIAGIRVICNYTEDVYTIEKLLCRQSDLKLIEKKDYIAAPKQNGYRSLHLIISIPVFLSDHTEDVPVEIQIRTIAMDFWASLEHNLRYKNPSPAISEYKNQLKDCADQLNAIEATMQHIHQQVH